MNMHTKNSWKKLTAALMLSLSVMAPTFTSAAASDDDIDAQIERQKQILAELNDQKKTREDNKLTEQIKSLQQQLSDIKKDQSKNSKYDAEAAVDALATQIADLEKQLKDQNSAQDRIESAISNLEKLIKQKDEAEKKQAQAQSGYSGTTSGFLVNPGPNANVGYTQDAINSQGNSTMIFRYAPNQVYKIYCRTGYLTDIQLHEGEKIKFVGGGDTSAWALNSTTVDKTPHLYIKPVVNTSTTNIIITTDKRSYQLIVNTSSWYNPMVKWVYDQEAQQMNLLQQQRDEAEITDTLKVSYDQLNFDYKIKNNGAKDTPSMVLDDGEKTIIKFKKANSKLPALFVRERGKRGVTLVNFKVKDNCFILDRLIDEAELRYSDKESVTITRDK